MNEIYLAKLHGVLTPADDESAKLLKSWPHGQMIRVKYSKVRNYRFLRKWFALLKVGFDAWEPGEINSKYGKPEKNFERFRADLIILAGFYESHVRLDGSVRIEPKSVSFAKMSEEEFSDLYSKTIDVLIKYVYKTDIKPNELNRIVDEFLSFA